MQTIQINNFGPIKEFKSEVSDFMVLTGEKGSGKDLVAKAIYFFNNICGTVSHSIASCVSTHKIGYSDSDHAKYIEEALTKRLEYDFINTFGYHYLNNPDVSLCYEYADNVTILVNSSIRKPVTVLLSDEIKSFLKQQANSLTDTSTSLDEIMDFFDLHKIPIYIPADRANTSMLLNIFHYYHTGVTEDDTISTINKCAKEYLDVASSSRDNSFDEGLNIEAVKQAQDLMSKILQGRYRYYDYRGMCNRDWLDLLDGTTVELVYATIEQQSVVWLLNIMYLMLRYNEKAYFIIEQPENNLCFSTQNMLMDFIAFIANQDNKILLTTDSHHIMSEMNVLLYAAQTSTLNYNRTNEVVSSDYWIDSEKFAALHISDGVAKNNIEHAGGFSEIICDIVDDASAHVDKVYTSLYSIALDEENKQD